MMDEEFNSEIPIEGEYSDPTEGMLINPKDLPPLQAYDSEWIKFMREISKNENLVDIVGFIDGCTWTDRQKKTIMFYCRNLLGRNFSTTLITSKRDYLMLYDDKALVNCDIALGLTNFDVTPEFNILLGMIDLHFGVAARNSKGGFLVKRIGAQRVEINNELNDNKRTSSAFKDSLKDKLGL